MGAYADTRKISMSFLTWRRVERKDDRIKKGDYNTKRHFSKIDLQKIRFIT